MSLQCLPSVNLIEAYRPGKSTVTGGLPAIKLSSNENPRGASPYALTAAHGALSKLHVYPDGQALVLRQAIAEICGYPIEQTICGTGSDDILTLAVRAYAGNGDEAIYSQYGFSLYPILIHAAGATPIAAPEVNYTAHVDNLLKAVTPRTRVMFVANPNNPTGTYLPRTEIDRLHAALPSSVLLVLDGAYAEYVTDALYSDGSHLVQAGAKNVLVTHTFSKIHALSALRVGRGFACPDIITILNKIRAPFNLSTVGIYAAAASLRDKKYIAACAHENAEQRTLLSQSVAAKGWHVLPSQANFVCVDFETTEQAHHIDTILQQRGLIVRDLHAYGLPHMLRISVGTPEQNIALLNALPHRD